LKGSVVPNDPWGNTYAFPGTHGLAYDLASLGADSREGGTEQAADIGQLAKIASVGQLTAKVTFSGPVYLTSENLARISRGEILDFPAPTPRARGLATN